MKRMWIAVFLFIFVIGLSTGGILMLNESQKDFQNRFDVIMALAEDEENAAALQNEAKKLTDYWIEKHNTLCRIVRHTQLDQITVAIARLEPLARYGEIGEFAAEVQRCKILLEDIWESELPLIRNIF